MRKKTITRLLIISFVIFSVLSCDKYFNCMEGNGRISSEYRSVNTFYGVENMTSLNVNIIYDTICSVRVEADENLMSSIRTYVNDGNLIIDTEHDRCIKSDRHILIDIRMPIMDKVEQNGSGDIDVYDFECDNLEIRNTGSGNIDLNGITSDQIDIDLVGSGSVTIAGAANAGDYSLTGSGEIFADDLTVDDCDVSISGSGDVYCYALDHLNISITGSGDVFYSGNPVLSISVTGSGDVHKRD